MNLDFTLKKYGEMCQALVSSEYIPLTVRDYLSQDQPEKSIILRHDVDKKPDQSRKMAHIEHDYGIRSTYYFRVVNKVFKPHIINEIAGLGHEIGYHYEVLDKAKGDYVAAIKVFGDDLKKLRELADITTVCMHGNPLTCWVNIDIWKKYDFNDFGIIGEPYLSIDYNKVSYFTDTGRAWNSSKYSVKDIISENPYNEKIRSTDELINLIKSGRQQNICILVHPNRWTDNLFDWLIELIWQDIKNVGKLLIINYKKISHE